MLRLINFGFSGSLAIILNSGTNCEVLISISDLFAISSKTNCKGEDFGVKVLTTSGNILNLRTLKHLTKLGSPFKKTTLQEDIK